MRIHGLLILLFVVACSSTKKDAQSSQNATDSSATMQQGPITVRDMSRFPDIQKQTNLNKIVRELETADCVNENGVGFSGEYTRTYALYERMKQLATETQLVAFLKNKSAVVRVYAFRAIKDLKYASSSMAKTILDEDTTGVCWYSGCVKSEVAVSSFSKSEE